MPPDLYQAAHSDQDEFKHKKKIRQLPNYQAENLLI